MNRERYHKLMFLSAAFWNWILAIAFLTLPRISMDYFYVAGPYIPESMLWFDSFMGLIFAFGIGFYLVSLNPRENHGLIKMAVFEKVWVFIIGLSNFLTATASIWVFAVVLGDLIFGLLFIEDLLSIKKLE